MAQYAIARLLDRLFELGGRSFFTLAPDIMPVMVLESDRPEWVFLKGGRLCVNASNVAGAVGFVSHVALFNPVDSGVIATVEHIVAGVATGNIEIAFVQPRLSSGAAGAAQSRDRRNTGQVTCQLETQNDGAGQGTLAWIQAIPNNEQRDILCTPIILPPGTCVTARSGNTNAQCFAAYTWRERPIEPSEIR